MILTPNQVIRIARIDGWTNVRYLNATKPHFFGTLGDISDLPCPNYSDLRDIMGVVERWCEAGPNSDNASERYLTIRRSDHCPYYVGLKEITHVYDDSTGQGNDIERDVEHDSLETALALALLSMEEK